MCLVSFASFSHFVGNTPEDMDQVRTSKSGEVIDLGIWIPGNNWLYKALNNTVFGLLTSRPVSVRRIHRVIWNRFKIGGHFICLRRPVVLQSVSKPDINQSRSLVLS